MANTISNVIIKKLPSEVFYIKGILKNFRKIHRKTPVPGSPFNKVAGLSLQLYSKETLTQVFSWEFCEFFKVISG